MCTAEPFLAAGPVDPARLAALEPLLALNKDVYVVDDAISVE